LGIASIILGGVLAIAGYRGASVASVVAGHPDATNVRQLAAAGGTGAAVEASPVAGVAGKSFGRAQLESLWRQAGGSAASAKMAAAIALAESGGRPGATDNDSNGSTDRGLWQINSVHGAASTYNPLGNAKAAVAISGDGANWTPWTTFTSGAFRKYL
jgi:hypothetical protein